MKTLHRHSSNGRGGLLGLLILSLVAVALVGADVLLGGPIRSLLRDGAGSAWRSVGNVSVALSESGLFISHRALAEENLALRVHIASLASLKDENTLLLEENTALRALTNTVESEQGGVTVPVLSQTDTSLYGTFLLGAGSAQGLIRGAQVRAEGGILLGIVSDVSRNTALVRSLLAPGASTEAHIGEAASITVSGRGGGNGVAQVPRDTEVSIGDLVYYKDLRSVIGVVGAIESSPENAEKRIYVRVPQNTLGIRFVTVLPPL